MKDKLPLNPDALGLDPPANGLASFPPIERWDNWTEYDSSQWPRKVEKHYSLIPTICFNCEAGCGLLAYVDKDKLRIQKFEGNPEHPGSRGRNCAKGPATINQVNDPERILYPLRRIGKRGEGKWERVTWDQVLDDLAPRIRKALQEGRKNEIMYHVGRPGHELIYNQRVLHAWGSTATTATPTCVLPERELVTRSGMAWTAPRPITPTRASSFFLARISKPDTTSIRTRSES